MLAAFAPAILLVPAAPSADQTWLLEAERSGFERTGRYAEAVAFCRRLAEHTPAARVVTLGVSPEGREIVALMVSQERQFSPSALRLAQKPLITVNNGIHSGEIEGKDASLILAREMLVEGKHPHLLKGANWIFVPIFSVDGHERFGPHHRVNQNGPLEMGWRANAQNLNLNRDFIKADGGEMRALVAHLRDYLPDFFVDTHTTDGSDHQYVLMLGVPMAQTLPPATAAWQRALYSRLKRDCEGDGFLTAPYFNMVDRTDPRKGISVSDFSPRFSTGYLTALNRPSLLVETHVLKPYRQRLEATRSVLIRLGEACIDGFPELRASNLAGDAAAKEGDAMVLTATTTEASVPFLFRGYPYAPIESPITGAKVANWDRTRPVDIEATLRDQFAPGLTVTLPAAYLVPAAWQDAIDRLNLHGIDHFRLPRDWTGAIASWRFEEVRFPARPFEARFSPTYRAVPIAETRAFAAGSVVVPIGQARAKLVAHLLEPEGPDSLVRWGFFNAVFENKEYAEDYAMEPIARRMLDANPTLKAAFAERLKDPAFAESPSARLAWFYERSPYFDVKFNKSPIARLNATQLAALRALRR